MQILPQLLYLFRTLPIPLPNSFFNSIQPIINKFLWQGRRARCAFNRLIKHRKVGGIGHVHLQDYYFATILTQIQHWLRADSNTTWKDIESTLIPKGNLKDFLLTTHLTKSLHKKLTPPILVSVRAWTHLCSYQNWSDRVTPLKFPISAFTHIIPDLNLTSWQTKGIY